MHITVPLNISLNEFLNNGKRYDGDNKFFNYNANSANCQIWILGLLMGNGLNDPRFIDFVKQDTAGIFSGKSGNVRKVSNSIVDLGKIGNILMSGGSIFRPVEGSGLSSSKIK